jgi:riboflavin synthase
MFTGIIQQMGTVASLTRVDFGARLVIDPAQWHHRPSLGDSIAVSGCCLTVADDPSVSGALAFDVIAQTLKMTTLGQLVPGQPVNLEHAATASTLLGGHIVQGHVDGVGSIARVQHDSAQCTVRIQPPAELMDYIVDQGSIAVDGVSLTVAAAGNDWFEVALIPTTLRLTTLGQARAGQRLNLEADSVAKTVVSWLRRMRMRENEASRNAR